MLRLTLRTLLAYLDDTLEPSEARDIGQRIKGNAQTQELIERCKTVMRRRRLSSPSPDPDKADLDANIVAAYLDNTLSHEKVGKAEKQFLKDDTELAEVACVHQILSMVLGKPADITPEARNRVYALVGGAPEKPVKARPIGPTPSRPDPRPVDPNLIDSQPLPLAIPAYDAGKGIKGKVVTIVSVFALTAALVGVIWQVVSPPEEIGDISSRLTVAQQRADDMLADVPAADHDAQPQAPQDAKEAEPAETTEPEPPAEPVPTAAERETPEPEETEPQPVPQEPAEEKAVPPTPEPQAEPDPEPATPQPAAEIEIDTTLPVAKVQSTGQVLLKQASGELQRLPQGDAIYSGDLLVNLEGFRSELDLSASLQIDLSDLTRIQVQPSTAEVFSFQFQRGRLIVSGEGRLIVMIDDQFLILEIDGENPVAGLELTLDAQPIPQKLFRMQVSRGAAAFFWGDQTGRVAAGHEMRFDLRSNPEIEPVRSSWSWILQPHDHTTRRNAENLARVLPYGEGLELAILLREQLSARTREVRRLAVRALAAIEADQFLLDAVDDNDADVRVTAIASLRELLHYEPDLVSNLRDNLFLLVDDQLSEMALEMILGYSAEELARKSTYERLVDRLNHDRLMIRELAFFNLKELTGRDMGYVADTTAVRRNTPIGQWRRWVADLDEDSLPLRSGQ